jgi:hypothetical protein
MQLCLHSPKCSFHVNSFTTTVYCLAYSHYLCDVAEDWARSTSNCASFVPVATCHGFTPQLKLDLRYASERNILAILMHKCTCCCSADAHNVLLLAILFTAWQICTMMCFFAYHTIEFMPSCDHAVQDSDVLSQESITFNVLAKVMHKYTCC